VPAQHIMAVKGQFIKEKRKNTTQHGEKLI
jgi:hypothetical protein